jgi:hypothetical protein
LVHGDRFYLSRAERNAGREALSEIDRLQASVPLTDDAFAAEARAAEVKIRTAERVEWTDRDIGVGFLLSSYLVSIQTERMLVKKHEANQGEERRAKWQQLVADDKKKLHQLLD